jgi:hypothetical protein
MGCWSRTFTEEFSVSFKIRITNAGEFTKDTCKLTSIFCFPDFALWRIHLADVVYVIDCA